MKLLNIIIVFNLLFLAYAINRLVSTPDYCESCQLYNVDAKFGITGVFRANSTSEYYCVWTKDRTEEQIQKTECHEIQHALINKNWSHFCEVK